jgi:chaperonin cofactor prefoldin
MIKRLSLISFLAILLTLSGASEIFAQQSPRQNQSEKTRPTQKTSDADIQKTEASPQSTDEALRTAITGLSNQVAILASELRRLREETQRNSERIEMLMYEERLGKIEAKMEEALNEKMNLDAREQEIQRRQRNIPQEALLRGGIRREEAEAAVKADLQRALDDVRERQESSQKRIADIQQQSDRISTRLEALRKKLEPPEKKDPNQQ